VNETRVGIKNILINTFDFLNKNVDYLDSISVIETRVNPRCLH